MSTTVFCVAPSQTVASDIVSRLKSSGFDDNDISVLFPDKSTTRDFAHEKNTKAPEGASIGAGAGGVAGGALGLLAGIGLLAVPGVGPFIAAGPIMAALSGIAVGAAAGGITGALIGMGIPEIEAKRYEGKLKDGNILISAYAEDSTHAKRAREIFENAHADDITTGSTADAPKATDKDMSSSDGHDDRKGSAGASAPRMKDRTGRLSDADAPTERIVGGRDPVRSQHTPRG